MKRRHLQIVGIVAVFALVILGWLVWPEGAAL